MDDFVTVARPFLAHSLKPPAPIPATAAAATNSQLRGIPCYALFTRRLHG